MDCKQMSATIRLAFLDKPHGKEKVEWEDGKTEIEIYKETELSQEMETWKK